MSKFLMPKIFYNILYPYLKPTYKETFIRNKGNRELCKKELKCKKLGPVQRFKFMYKNYWYLLIPVHAVLTVGWIWICYCAAQTKYVTENIKKWENDIEHASDFIDKFLDILTVNKGEEYRANVKQLAVTIVIYKICFPLRITSTVTVTAFVKNKTVSVSRYYDFASDTSLVTKNISPAAHIKLIVYIVLTFKIIVL